MAAEEKERAWQAALLSTPTGVPGGGAIRYGAAMYFHMRGQISAPLLEVYRCCCNLDNEDPIDLARFEGVAELPKPEELKA